MFIKDYYTDENLIKVIIDLDILTIEPTGVLPITSRWKSVAKLLKRDLDIPLEYNIIEIRGGLIWFDTTMKQSFMFIYEIDNAH